MQQWESSLILLIVAGGTRTSLTQSRLYNAVFGLLTSARSRASLAPPLRSERSILGRRVLLPTELTTSNFPEMIPKQGCLAQAQFECHSVRAPSYVDRAASATYRPHQFRCSAIYR